MKGLLCRLLGHRWQRFILDDQPVMMGRIAVPTRRRRMRECERCKVLEPQRGDNHG